jgi:thiamine biosynthesis lipoprotein
VTAAPTVDRVVFPALGTTVNLVVTDAGRLPAAERVLRRELAELDLACSRFRDDSEITALHTRAGREAEVSPLLFAALTAAIRAARLTEGLVDPTVGQAVVDLGYDRDFAALTAVTDAVPARPAPGWWRITLTPDPANGGGRVLLPRGVRLDLGASAKAFAADRIARLAYAAADCGVLVDLGGDIATAGAAPESGWRIGIAADHRTARSEPDETVTIVSGGLATSSTARRSWSRAGRQVHHIVDPTTGDIPDRVWRVVSVSAASCLDANTASTAAIVLGERAPGWLARHRLPGRLVGEHGEVRRVAGWPADGNLTTTGDRAESASAAGPTSRATAAPGALATTAGPAAPDATAAPGAPDATAGPARPVARPDEGELG